MQPNRRGFAEYASKEFAREARGTAAAATCDQGDIIKTLQPHQKVIAKYMKDHHGILVYHSLGSGKTCAAINSIVPGMHTIVMLKASIEPNFLKEITKCGPGVSPTFVHYNGLSKTIVQSFVHNIQTRACFVIIDEVHNFISAVINNPKGMQAKMHEAMCRSETLKIVALSGTPFINQPREVAFLINLVKGYTVLDVITFVSGTGVTSLQIKDALHKVPHIDFVETIDFKKNELSVRILPGAPQGNYIAQALSTIGVAVVEHTKKYVQLITQNEKDFNDTFIDARTMKFKNHQAFLRRIMGAVSYYGHRDPGLFPRTTVDELVECEMSSYQAKKYAELRVVEIERERMSATRPFETEEDGQVYKTFSRISCNFVFPENIKRPFKSTLSGTETYDAALEKAIEKVTSDKSTLTTDLQKHSCKFAEILARIKKSPGSALVYSNYRRVEGITLFTEVLKLNGFAQFDESYPEDVPISKNQNFFMTFDGQVSGPMLGVFNALANGNLADSPLAMRIAKAKGCSNNVRGDIIKVILVTQSGSEGINLLNVRQVHIMEPHWNNIRHHQVIGRAIRTCSHQALPEKDRTIEVYRYIAKLPKDMVVLKDGNKCTDELIMDIGAKKAVIIDDILELMKAAAIDCLGACFKMDGRAEDKAYELDINMDIIGDLNVTTTKKKYKRIDIKGKTYLMDGVTNELYDWDKYENGNGLRYAGKLVDMGEGKWVVL